MRKIVVSNDDGITSKGIDTLVKIAAEFGQVIVVAPDKPQSGMGHAITIGETLRLEKNHLWDDLQIDAYECSGTPADCVKLAKNYVLNEHKPDLILSGINHGSNTSISVLYSGTMSAAIEGALEGIPSIGFSLCDWSHEATMEHAIPYIKTIIKNVIEKGLKKGIALNVNIPAFASGAIKGIKVCKQANARWVEKFEKRLDPNGRPYFWMGGEFVDENPTEDEDETAINDNYISIVPCQHDLTDYAYKDELTDYFKE